VEDQPLPANLLANLLAMAARLNPVKEKIKSFHGGEKLVFLLQGRRVGSEEISR
jgi:hypothetical protein